MTKLTNKQLEEIFQDFKKSNAWRYIPIVEELLILREVDKVQSELSKNISSELAGPLSVKIKLEMIQMLNDETKSKVEQLKKESGM